MERLQFEQIVAWQKETFGESTAQSKIKHLREKIEELAFDVHIQAPNRRLEFADCFFLLFGAAAADGMTYDEIIDAIDDKFAINKARLYYMGELPYR